MQRRPRKIFPLRLLLQPRFSTGSLDGQRDAHLDFQQRISTAIADARKYINSNSSQEETEQYSPQKEAEHSSQNETDLSINIIDSTTDTNIISSPQVTTEDSEDSDSALISSNEDQSTFKIYQHHIIDCRSSRKTKVHFDQGTSKDKKSTY